MRLTTVLSAVNENQAYYLFIPKQIKFWKKFGIKFIAIFIGTELPDSLQPYRDNIILWNNTYKLNSAYIGQNIRLYYPALLNLPDDEMVMITDMDMLPMNDRYYKEGIQNCTSNDFVYYRHIDGNQIYMCYNAAHPKVWAKIFNITTEFDIDKLLLTNYNNRYNGRPGDIGWSIDQEVLYNFAIQYPYLKVLNKPLKRLEMWDYKRFLGEGRINFVSEYDDCHFHRNYLENEILIQDAEKQLGI
jgi:hypothetical protein